MSGFKTHITASTLLGAGYGAAAHLGFGMPLDKCLLAAGLCSVSGMLPDLDSDSGVPVRETFAFGAAVVPMLMVDRFQHMGLSHESMVLAGALVYLLIRFGLAEIFRAYTVHRGMWHSLPAACIAGLLAFLICSCDNINYRFFKMGAVMIGFVSHLLLDELASIDWSRGLPRFKKSFGTAFKLYSGSAWANFSTYGKLTLLIGICISDPLFMETFGHHEPDVPHTATEWLRDTMSGDGHDHQR